MSAILDNATVQEARSYAERGLAMFSTLHIGPLDFNVTQAVDYLRTAAALLEDFQREQNAAEFDEALQASLAKAAQPTTDGPPLPSWPLPHKPYA